MGCPWSILKRQNFPTGFNREFQRRRTGFSPIKQLRHGELDDSHSTQLSKFDRSMFSLYAFISSHIDLCSWGALASLRRGVLREGIRKRRQRRKNRISGHIMEVNEGKHIQSYLR